MKKRKRPGRPSKGIHARRCQVTIAVTAAEKEIIWEKAYSSGKSLSNLIRERIIDLLVKVPEEPESEVFVIPFSGM